jgi:hypothetical protein
MSDLRYEAVLGALKFGGLVALNLVIAVIGTAILDTPMGRMIPAHSIAAVIWKECILSILCAALIGFGMGRAWRNSAAKWTWIPAAAWFAFGLAVAGRGDVLGRLSVFGSGNNLGAAEVRSFFAFAIPLIRAISYSAGAHISSLLHPAPVGSGS